MPFLGVIFFLEDELPPKVFLKVARKPMVEGGMTRGWKCSRVKSKGVEMYPSATGNSMAVGPFGIGAWERMREGCTKILQCGSRKVQLG